MLHFLLMASDIPITDPAVALAAAMASAAAQAAASQQAIVQIVGLLVTTLGTIVLAFIAYKQAILSKSLEATHQRATQTADSVEKIHVAVNSERTAMNDKIDQLQEVILQLSKEKAVTQEKEKEKEKDENHNQHGETKI